MKRHLRSFRIVSVIFFATTLLAINALAQQQPEAPPVPVPAQITSAKKVFIANAGVDGDFFDPNVFSGGANRAYDQFYAAMKAWGQYEMAFAPADADLVFEIGQINRNTRTFGSELRLRILDPKTNITLWTVTNYVVAAGLTKTREKNYNMGMTTLVNDLKIVVTPSPAAKN